MSKFSFILVGGSAALLAMFLVNLLPYDLVTNMRLAAFISIGYVIGAHAWLYFMVFRKTHPNSEVTSANDPRLTDPVYLALREGRCPDCGSTEFFEGPSGGMAQNIECANGHKFNIAIAPGMGLLFAERI